MVFFTNSCLYECCILTISDYDFEFFRERIDSRQTNLYTLLILDTHQLCVFLHGYSSHCLFTQFEDSFELLESLLGYKIGHLLLL